MEKNEIIVNSEMEGMRLDRYLRKSFKNEPLSRIFSAIRSGDVKINGKKSKENYRLLLNDKVIIKNLSIGNIKKNEKAENKIKKLQISQNELEKYKKMVIFENEDFFIVNKAEKIPMHKGTGHKYGLSEVFKKIYKSENINFANRLDFETSGLVIGCKTLKFLRYISEKIRENKVHKKYFAIVHNREFKNENEFLKSNSEKNKSNFKIENYLTTAENKVIVSKNPISKESKKSITHFKSINFNKLKNSKKILNLLGKNNKNIVLLDIELITGRKHQIRAQLAYRGFAIVGDKKYGKKDKSNRFFLCCYFLSFDNYEFSIFDRAFF